MKDINDYVHEKLGDKEKISIKQKNSEKFREKLNFVFKNFNGSIIELQKSNGSPWEVSNDGLKFEEVGYLYDPPAIYLCLNSKDGSLFRYFDKSKKSIHFPGFGFYTRAFTDEKKTSESFVEFVYLPESVYKLLNSERFSRKKMSTNFNSYVANASTAFIDGAIDYFEKEKIRGKSAANNLKKIIFGEDSHPDSEVIIPTDKLSYILLKSNAAKDGEQADKIINTLIHGRLEYDDGIMLVEKTKNGNIKIINTNYMPEKEFKNPLYYGDHQPGLVKGY